MAILVFTKWVFVSFPCCYKALGFTCLSTSYWDALVPHKVLFLAFLNMGSYHDRSFLPTPWCLPVYCQFLANLVVHAADKRKVQTWWWPSWRPWYLAYLSVTGFYKRLSVIHKWFQTHFILWRGLLTTGIRTSEPFPLTCSKNSRLGINCSFFGEGQV